MQLSIDIYQPTYLQPHVVIRYYIPPITHQYQYITNIVLKIKKRYHLTHQWNVHHQSHIS